VAAVGGTFYLGSGSPAPSLPETAQIATIPGRPATVHQSQKAEERREAERALLRERLREAEIKSELEQKRRAEEALLRPGGEGLRSRPVIGKDGRDRSANSG
jgi:membrane carboxypeptidase/penicillin-binding protein PbpC